MAFDLLDIFSPVHLIRDAAKALSHGKVVQRQWTGGWSINTADAAHRLMVSAGSGNAEAQGQLRAIRAAAAAGDPDATRVMKLMAPVARMVQKNLGTPSAVAATLAQKRKRQMQQRQQATIKKQQEQLKAMRRQQVDRAKKSAFQKKVQRRFAAEQKAFDAEAIALEDKVEALAKQLERRDISDAMREQLEAQAEAYEQEIDRVTAEKAGQPVPSLDNTESMPDVVEGESNMMGEDYPTGAQGGAPGDVEFTEA